MTRLELDSQTNPESAIWWGNLCDHARGLLTTDSNLYYHHREAIGKLLKEQGATTSPHFWSLGTKSYIEFARDADATVFLLRWS